MLLKFENNICMKEYFLIPKRAKLKRQKFFNMIIYLWKYYGIGGPIASSEIKESKILKSKL